MSRCVSFRPCISCSKMAPLSDLLATGLIENDTNGDILWTWSYPSISNDLRELVMRRCCYDSENLVPFMYGHSKNIWFYMSSRENTSGNLPKVTHLTLVLTARDFNPEKYEELCNIMARHYLNTGNPSSMLESYLSVVTKGSCNGEENGSLIVKAYDNRQAYAMGSIRSVVNLFGIEIILLYTAILLKKRVVVYHPNIEDLLSLIRVFPALVWHRQNWDILYPCVQVEDTELDEMQKLSTFVAGFTDAVVEARQELYDLFVNASSPEVVISPKSKDVFAMGKLHKEIATHIIECCEDSSKSEQQIIKDIGTKTKELLNNLKTLAVQDDVGQPVIMLETLRERKMQKTTENFLFNLAAAEGLVKM